MVFSPSQDVYTILSKYDVYKLVLSDRVGTPSRIAKWSTFVDNSAVTGLVIYDDATNIYVLSVALFTIGTFTATSLVGDVITGTISAVTQIYDKDFVKRESDHHPNTFATLGMVTIKGHNLISENRWAVLSRSKYRVPILIEINEKPDDTYLSMLVLAVQGILTLVSERGTDIEAAFGALISEREYVFSFSSEWDGFTRTGNILIFLNITSRGF